MSNRDRRRREWVSKQEQSSTERHPLTPAERIFYRAKWSAEWDGLHPPEYTPDFTPVTDSLSDNPRLADLLKEMTNQ